MEFHGNVHPDCPSAVNPFHECSYRCFERIGSGEVKKEKKLFGSFGKKTPSRSSPPSPGGVTGDKSPLPSYYYAKKKAESDGAPSFSSSDENPGSFWEQPSPARPSQAQSRVTEARSHPLYYYFNKKEESDDAPAFSSSDENSEYFWKQSSPGRGQSSQTKPVSGNSTVVENMSLPLSPSLAVYIDHGDTTRTPDRRRDETPKDLSKEKKELQSQPRTPKHRPRTPEHGPKTPERPTTPEHRPRTPKHGPMTTEHWPRTPEHRPTTPERRPRTPERRPRTAEPRPMTHEPLHRSVEPRPSAIRIEGHRRPRLFLSSEKKAESVYSEDDDESILLFPEILLSPEPKRASRPTTPERHRIETPRGETSRGETSSKQDKPEEKTESVNIDDLSVGEEGSICLHPEMASSSETKPRSPTHYKFRGPCEQGGNEKHYEPPELLDESQSFSLYEIAKIRGMKNYDNEEFLSMISESCVSVGNYKVRASISSTLQSILDKYGDIASGSKLQSVSTRSYYLESLSSVVLELKSTPLKELTETRVTEVLALVKDMESVKIEVSWLQGILNELVEAVKHFSRHETAMAEKQKCDNDLECARKEMEVQMRELGLKEKEVEEFRQKLTEIGGRLGHLEMNRSGLTKKLTFLESKDEKFQGKSVLEELL